MIFRDREQAAEKRADALRHRRGSNPLVAAIPRGAVPMGAIIAQRLGGSLDVVLVRKLVAPCNRELAIGAVDETGWTYVAPHARSVGATSAYIETQVAHELATIRDRRKRYTPDQGPLDPTGRVMIVVDDGLATGATMVAALHALRARGPRELVCAIPVASREALGRSAVCRRSGLPRCAGLVLRGGTGVSTLPTGIRRGSGQSARCRLVAPGWGIPVVQLRASRWAASARRAGAMATRRAARLQGAAAAPTMRTSRLTGGTVISDETGLKL